MSTPQWVDWLSGIGSAGVLALIIATGLKGVWLWRWQHREIVEIKDRENEELRADRNYWRDAAMRGIVAAEEAVRQSGKSVR